MFWRTNNNKSRVHETRLASLHHNPGTEEGSSRHAGKIIKWDESIARVSSYSLFSVLFLVPCLPPPPNSLGGDICIIIVTIKEGGSNLLTTLFERWTNRLVSCWCRDSISWLRFAKRWWCIVSEIIRYVEIRLGHWHMHIWVQTMDYSSDYRRSRQLHGSDVVSEAVTWKALAAYLCLRFVGSWSYPCICNSQLC